MKVKLNDYVNSLEEIVKSEKKVDKDFPKDVYSWICFYQHERLIHLIVTFFTGIGMILFLIAALHFESIMLLVLFLLTLCLFIPYILYYYYLENNVQKLYDLYFEIKEKATKN